MKDDIKELIERIAEKNIILNKYTEDVSKNLEEIHRTSMELDHLLYQYLKRISYIESDLKPLI